MVTAASSTAGASAFPIPTAAAAPVEWAALGGAQSTHSVQFYADSAVLLEGLTRYVGAPLGAGDAAVVIAAPAHREGLRDRLARRGVGVERLMAEGRYVSLDAAETLERFMRGGRPDRASFFEVVGGVLARATSSALSATPRVYAYGEMVAILWADGEREAALQVEGLWNELAETRSFALHCAYPLSLLAGAADGDLMRAVCENHTLVVPVESYAALVDDRDRLAAIALLQQKARALESEIEERRRCERELEAALELRDQFLSAITHDLKTPLAGIKAGAQLLQRRVARGTVRPDQLVSDLASLDTGATRLTRMVEQLLDIARIQSGRPPELDLRPTDLVSLVERLASEHQRATERHAISVKAEESKLVGRCDGPRLERVLDNLLSNARKYSPEGGDIVMTVSRADDDTAHIAVRDHGIGIPAADLPRIFEQFHRATNVDERISGTGIGLASAHKLVTLHGGSLDVESVVGRGSTFTIRLPLAGPAKTPPSA
ncbi:MAG TPA: ATP-binding protein [Chloroflexota bacterium]|nr:ATP-binding protein [Chloroflexota bacterium]